MEFIVDKFTVFSNLLQKNVKNIKVYLHLIKLVLFPKLLAYIGKNLKIIIAFCCVKKISN